MDFGLAVFVAAAGYLIGSISFARVVGRFVQPEVSLDQARVHKAESGEKGTISGIGASTASKALGKKYGGIVALLDILKAFVPVLLLGIFFPGQPYRYILSIFAILGHVYPIYYRFNGGRGMSPMLGSLLAIEPLGLVVALILGTLVSILINMPQTSFLLWFPILILWAWLVRVDLALVVYSVLLVTIFLIAAIPEFRLAFQYRRQGRQEEYNEIILDSAPNMRMIRRLSQRVRFWEKDRIQGNGKSR